ncbi:hypothetical protein [Arthrobacter sp.]|uniref:hypothetical protein n=1 Tax=Arthrobacter sp. TaxID=1667 RepID=UPI003390F989
MLPLMAAALLSACTEAPGDLSPATPADNHPVSAAVDQGRAHYSDRVVNLMITNISREPVLVTSATLHSPLYEGAADWKPTRTGGTRVPAGSTVSLPAQLPPAQCSAGQPAEAATHRMTVTMDSERSGLSTVEVQANDPHNVLSRNYSEDCVAQAAALVADLRIDQTLRVLPGSGSAVVGIDVHPSGGKDSLVIESIGTTTLLDEDGKHAWPRNLRVHGTDPASRLDLHIVPMRCDPHALAEDKQGTRIPVSIAAGSWHGIVRLNAGHDFDRAVYRFITDACADAGQAG